MALLVARATFGQKELKLLSLSGHTRVCWTQSSKESVLPSPVKCSCRKSTAFVGVGYPCCSCTAASALYFAASRLCAGQGRLFLITAQSADQTFAWVQALIGMVALQLLDGRQYLLRVRRISVEHKALLQKALVRVAALSKVLY